MTRHVVCGAFLSTRVILAVCALVAVSCAKHSGVGSGRDAASERTELQIYTGVWLHKETKTSSGRGQLSVPFTYGAVPSPEVVQAVVAETRRYPKKLVIGVEDSFFTMSSDMPGWSLALALNGSERAVVRDSTGLEFSVGLTWSGGTPVVHRSFGVGRAIVDAIEITEDSMLVVTRTVRWGPDRSRDNFQYLYVRGGRTDAGPPRRNPQFSGVRHPQASQGVSSPE